MFYNPHIHSHAQQAHPRRHRRHRTYSLAGLLVIIAVLAIISRFHQIDYATFYKSFTVSLVRVVIAYVVSACIALFFALLATRSQKFESFLLPILDVAQSFPSFALLPLLVSIFGHSSISVIVILIIAMVWPILFSIVGAIKTERTDLVEAAKLYGAVGLKNLRFYRLPMLLPSLMTGSIVAWGEAWDVLVGAEIIAVAGGIGAYLGNLGGNSASATALFLGIGLYLLFIFVINDLVWLPLLHSVSRYQNEN